MTQEENRRRINEALERQFPGVTEDEQNPTGMYMPDPRNYQPGYDMFAANNYYETHQPMRRRLWAEPTRTTEGTSDETLDGDITRWSEEEEDSYRAAVEDSENVEIIGTGEWAQSLYQDQIEEFSGYPLDDYSGTGWTLEEVENANDRGLTVPLSRQEAWLSGEIGPSNETYVVPTTRNFEDSRIDLFDHGPISRRDKSQEAPYEADIRNVKEWAKRHREEVDITKNEDTQWKERFNKLKDDVANTTVPLLAHGPPNTKTIREQLEHTQMHLEKLQAIWDNRPVTPRTAIKNAAVATSFARQYRSLNEVVNRSGNMRHVAGTHAAALEYDSNAQLNRLDTDALDAEYRPRVGDTDTVYSYYTPIAWRQPSSSSLPQAFSSPEWQTQWQNHLQNYGYDRVVVSAQRHSNVTTRHQRAVRHALNWQGYHSPQELADEMLRTSYMQDRYKQTAGQPVGYEHYFPKHAAYVYIDDPNAARSEAQDIVEKQLAIVAQKQLNNAKIANRRRPRNFLKPYTRGQQRRLEMGGQLRLPLSLNDRGRNAQIMSYPIILGYSGANQ
jgi:hypothetical protein